MPKLLILVGTVLLVFFLVTFTQVPLIGCYMSSTFTVESNVFGRKAIEPLCITPGIYYMCIIFSVVIIIIGVYHAFLKTGAASQTLQRAIQSGQTHIQTSPSDNGWEQKWEALKEIDSDIANAALEAKKIGAAYEKELMKKYMVLNDKMYLSSIIESLKAKANTDKATEIDFHEAQKILSRYQDIFGVKNNYVLVRLNGTVTILNDAGVSNWNSMDELLVRLNKDKNPFKRVTDYSEKLSIARMIKDRNIN